MPLGFGKNAGLLSAAGGFAYSTVGTVTTRTYGLYTSLQWLGSGSFTVDSNGGGLTCDVFVQGGGGGGGMSNPGPGGGGAGGFREFTSVAMPVGTYTISVGGGGSSSNPGANGTPSYHYIGGTFQSAGGGGGRYWTSTPGGSGGSGGGGSYYGGQGSGNTPNVSPSQGYPGGGGYQSSYQKGGGGGGAGGPGQPAYTSYMVPTGYQDGGVGRYNYYARGSGTSVAIEGFAGGGGGYASAGWRGRGGGGGSSWGAAYGAGSGATNSGAGGAALPYHGGSGTVIIRFLTP